MLSEMTPQQRVDHVAGVLDNLLAAIDEYCKAYGKSQTRLVNNAACWLQILVSKQQGDDALKSIAVALTELGATVAYCRLLTRDEEQDETATAGEP